MTQPERRTLTPFTILILCVAALVSRMQIFGNPIVYTDEEFYLLVGDRMLQGAIPYVDLWDRKPVGLFLLYTLMRTLGGDGVLAYQIVGTLFAVGTALLIVRIAATFSERWGAVASGVAYLAWLNLGTAGGGQSPVFYNFFMCAAGLITLRAVSQEAASRTKLPGSRFRENKPLLLPGIAAMLLVGIAMQIKYSAVFEGVFFGLGFLVLAWKSTSPGAVLLAGMLMVGAALLPTILAAAAYVVSGHGQAFFFANFVSIFERGGQSGRLKLLAHLALLLLILAPLTVSAAWPPARADASARVAHRFVLQWLVVALFALVIFGTYLQSYLLPVLVPAAAGAAALFGCKRARLAAAALIALAFAAGNIKVAIDIHKRGTAESFSRIVAAIDPAGCLFVYSGEPAYYRATTACIPTRFAFPSHLARLGESAALGIDPRQEITRIMRTAPRTVIMSQPYNDEDRVARATVTEELRRHYDRILATKLGQNDVEVFRVQPNR